MSPKGDPIADLAALTAEMVLMQDLSGRNFADLMERRGELIRDLIRNRFDPADTRLLLIIGGAAALQERLQRRAQSLRGDLSELEGKRALITAAGSTILTQQRAGIDLKA